LFVALAEEVRPIRRLPGWLRRYLEPLRSYEIDTLVLGCTHYLALRRHRRDNGVESRL
jgi:glutamate racemase